MQGAYTISIMQIDKIKEFGSPNSFVLYFPQSSSVYGLILTTADAFLSDISLVIGNKNSSKWKGDNHTYHT